MNIMKINTMSTNLPEEHFATNIVFKKWIFSKRLEARLCRERRMRELVLEQAWPLQDRKEEVFNLIDSDLAEEVGRNKEWF